IEAVVLGLVLVRRAPYLLLRRQVRHDELRPRRARGALHLRQSGPALVGVAGDDDDVSSLAGERDGGGLADSLVGAGDEDGLALHVSSLLDGTAPHGGAWRGSRAGAFQRRRDFCRHIHPTLPGRGYGLAHAD